MKLSFYAAAAIVVFPQTAFAAQASKTAGKAAATDVILACEQTTASGLGYTIIKPGEGENPAANNIVSVNYSGRLASNGTEFDSGEGTNFPVQNVIPGFAEGLQLMKPGASYRLCVPATLGYGAADQGTIPPNSDLVFEVDLLSAFAIPEPVVEIIPEAQRKCDAVTPSGMGYKELSSGLGNAPTDEDITLINVKMYEAETGKVVLDQSWQQVPLPSASGPIAEALKLMNKGASYRFCVPSEQLEASPGAEGVAVPDMNFHIDLVDMKKISEIR